MEKRVEATIACRVIYGLYWGYKGTMEKKMEATIVYRAI